MPRILTVALIVLWSAAAHGTTRYVDAAGSCGGNTPCYTTIQGAINASVSADNDVIQVYDGTYNYLELGTTTPNTKENLTIQAVNQGGPTIQATSTGDQPVIYLEGVDNTTIDGFNLVRSSASGRGVGVFVFNPDLATAMSATIKNCTMSGADSFRAGVRLLGFVNVTIQDNTITGARDAGIATSVGLDLPYPNQDFLYGAPVIIIKGNTIDGTIDASTESARAGIFLKGYDDAPLNTAQITIGGSGTEKNIIRDNGNAGIRLEDIYGVVTIDNNEIASNGQAGLALIDVGTNDTAMAVIRNNDIHDNTMAGVNVVGATYLTIGPNNNIYNNGRAGVTFYKQHIDTLYGDAINDSSEPVTITENSIYDNDKGGIHVEDPLGGKLTISDNDVYGNKRAGVSLQHDCEVEITGNDIYNHNNRGGIHTGQHEPSHAFHGTDGGVVATIAKNKVRDNGSGTGGGGMSVKHASGTIRNNLVYNNYNGGILFGNHIDEISNNTVSDNGRNGEGGGIIFDGPDADGQPDGTLTADPVIKYNIITDNEAAGLRVGGYSPGTWYACPVASANRNFNLLYGNHPWNDAQNKANSADCGWYQDGGLSYVSDRSCGQQQYGGCGVGSPPPYWPLINSSDIMDDPLLDTDYTLLPGSPAIGAGPSGTDMGAYGGLDPLEP